jgi:hypothetical protein
MFGTAVRKNILRKTVHGCSVPDLKDFYTDIDPYPDFTGPDPDPAYLLAIVHKYNILIHHITAKKFSAI